MLIGQIAMNKSELPYFELFDSFRKHKDFDLGLSDYFALLEALQGGFAFDLSEEKVSKNKLTELCQLLWLKPYHSPRLFNYVLEVSINKALEKEKSQEKEEKQ
jgi:hypothetical protein